MEGSTGGKDLVVEDLKAEAMSLQAYRISGQKAASLKSLIFWHEQAETAAMFLRRVRPH